MLTMKFAEFVQNGQTFDLPVLVLLTTIGRTAQIQRGIAVEFSKNPGGVIGLDRTDQNGNARKTFSGLVPGQSYTISIVNTVERMDRVDENIKVPALPSSSKPVPVYFPIVITHEIYGDWTEFLLVLKVLDKHKKGIQGINVVLYIGTRKKEQATKNGQVSFTFLLQKGEEKEIVVTPEGYGKHSIKRTLRGKGR